MDRIVIPSIDEINDRAGTNGLNVISTFAGCGGSSTGYKMAGYSVPIAIEYVDKAAETYRANAPSTIVLEQDIREITGAELMDIAGIGEGELDILDGSPPCQSFSRAGLREKAWGEAHHYSGRYSQRTDDLFEEFLRLVAEMKPKVVVAENVMGLVSGMAQGYFVEIMGALEDLGYRADARKIEAVRLGVPQRRERIIFMGVREDLNKDPVFPKPIYGRRYVSIQRAFNGLDEPGEGEASWLREGTRTRMAWDYTDVVRDPHGCFRHAYQRLFAKDARYMWFKLPPHKPAPTLTAKVPCLCHWAEPRTLSLAEIKRISTFPDDFVLPGPSFKHKWERIGRSVPPLMMYHIAKTIQEEILT